MKITLRHWFTLLLLGLLHACAPPALPARPIAVAWVPTAVPTVEPPLLTIAVPQADPVDEPALPELRPTPTKTPLPILPRPQSTPVEDGVFELSDGARVYVPSQWRGLVDETGLFIVTASGDLELTVFQTPLYVTSLNELIRLLGLEGAVPSAGAHSIPFAGTGSAQAILLLDESQPVARAVWLAMADDGSGYTFIVFGDVEAVLTRERTLEAIVRLFELESW